MSANRSDPPSPRRVIPIAPERPAGQDSTLISLYASRQKIYPRSVSGFFSRWRWLTVWLTQIVFYGLPWLEWNARQAVLFDLDARRFYIFNLVLYPQDFIYLTGLLVIAALSLFLFTAVAGRLWCGYACPQTVYTEIFLWIEKKIEGDRMARMRLDQASFSVRKLAKKWLKHAAWLLFALWTGFSFVGYFTPIRELATLSMSAALGPWQTFWVFFYGFATYGNAGFMREQVCKYMCPYARFQSAMFDKDTLIVTYDQQRGEPRGARSKKTQVQGLGACIDCTLCVQVCPTGIDIRQGLQYECIGCGACIDVCNDVMDKMGYARGLIKYATERSMAPACSGQKVWARAFRPRVLVYAGILGSIALALGLSLWIRTPLKVDVIRDRGALARIVGQGRIENVFRLHIMNATESTQRYALSVSGLPGIAIASPAEIEVLPAQVRSAAVRVQIAPHAAGPGSHPIYFDVRTLPDARVAQVSEKAAFLVPH